MKCSCGFCVDPLCIVHGDPRDTSTAPVIPFPLKGDETYFDVHCLVPVHLRFLADDEQSAREQFTDVEMTVTGPHVAHSTGFPQEMTVKAVAPSNG